VNSRITQALASLIGTAFLAVNLTGCSARGGASAGTSAEALESSVSITAFAKEDSEREYLAVLITGVRFEERNGCLYVGEDQAVWFYGTTVRAKPGTTQYEVLDFKGRKLAETGTSVTWGGGQVSAAEAETYRFADKLKTSDECKQRSDSYWIVGQIQSPLFETSN
jgi:hypothetical protein